MEQPILDGGLHKAYKSTFPFIGYVFKDGSNANFVNGLYHTDNPEFITELDNEVGNIGLNNSKHPIIYIDELEQTVDPQALTPMAIMEKQIRAKILAEQAAAGDITNDRGNSNANFAQSISNTITGAAQLSGDAGVNAALASLNTLKTSTDAPVTNTTSNTFQVNS